MTTDLAAALDKSLGAPTQFGGFERCDYVLAATRVVWAAAGQGIEPTFLRTQNAERFFTDIRQLQESKDCFAKVDHNSRLGKHWRRVRGQLLKRFAPATRFDPWMPNAFEHEAALIIKASVGTAMPVIHDRLCNMLAMWLETPEVITTPDGVSSLGVYYAQIRQGAAIAAAAHPGPRWRHVREIVATL